MHACVHVWVGGCACMCVCVCGGGGMRVCGRGLRARIKMGAAGSFTRMPGRALELGVPLDQRNQIAALQRERERHRAHGSGREA